MGFINDSPDLFAYFHHGRVKITDPVKFQICIWEARGKSLFFKSHYQPAFQSFALMFGNYAKNTIIRLMDFLYLNSKINLSLLNQLSLPLNFLKIWKISGIMMKNATGSSL